MPKKRTKLEVIKDILNVIKSRNGKIKPTHILYKSNLSHQMMEEYILELKEKGFILEKSAKKGRTYEITDKGMKYLSEYETIVNFTSTFGLN